MIYDNDTSEEVLVFLKFALDCCREPRHLREFFDKNKDVISSLVDDDKETLRGVWRETQDRLRKAA